jgi:hypothetical protein
MFREEGEAEREKLVELLLTVMLATLDVVVALALSVALAVSV